MESRGRAETSCFHVPHVHRDTNHRHLSWCEGRRGPEQFLGSGVYSGQHKLSCGVQPCRALQLVPACAHGALLAASALLQQPYGRAAALRGGQLIRHGRQPWGHPWTLCGHHIRIPQTGLCRQHQSGAFSRWLWASYGHGAPELPESQAGGRRVLHDGL